MGDWHDEARRLRAEGWTLQRIAERFGISRQRVHQVLTGYSRDRYQNDPKFRERQHARWRDRYHNDPEFRERRKVYCREYQRRKRAEARP